MGDTPSKVATKRSLLPYSKMWPILVGAVLGLILRLVFNGDPGNAFSAMDSAFILFVPLAVGAVTAYIPTSREKCSLWYCAVAGMLANVFFVIGTMLVFIEGLICAVIILPLFAVFGALGGLIMGAVAKYYKWPKQTVYSFASLPLLMVFVLPSGAGTELVKEIESTAIINASPDAIWSNLVNTSDIQPKEVKRAWMYRIGVPVPISGVAVQSENRLTRRVTMGKSVYFDQISTKWEENEFVQWDYRFYPDSFPPKALDDHVKIGGHYFDIKSTTYSIRSIDSVSSELTVSMKYRISTQFNWYADIMANLLIENFEEVILDFYKNRSELSDVIG